LTEDSSSSALLLFLSWDCDCCSRLGGGCSIRGCSTLGFSTLGCSTCICLSWDATVSAIISCISLLIMVSVCSSTCGGGLVPCSNAPGCLPKLRDISVDSCSLTLVLVPFIWLAIITYFENNRDEVERKYRSWETIENKRNDRVERLTVAVRKMNGFESQLQRPATHGRHQSTILDSWLARTKAGHDEYLGPPTHRNLVLSSNRYIVPLLLIYWQCHQSSFYNFCLSGQSNRNNCTCSPVFYTMLRMGFNAIFVRWIMACIQFPSFSFNLNGKPCGFITGSRGIRQGDPLSPYLFIIISEFLSAKIHNAAESGSYKGIRLSRNGPTLTHLLFADDTLLFCKAEEQQAAKILQILQAYHCFTRQQVNMVKSSIFFSRNAPTSLKSRCCSILSGIQTHTSTRYLGLPMGIERSKREAFDYILSVVKKRVCNWKNKWLSTA
ncbi:Uncharacterized mitochondrial protein AtMg01250, partial [Striga hermonthica]